MGNSQPTMPVSSTPPIQNPVSNPLFLEVSDKFWSFSLELLDKFIFNSFLDMSTGSSIEIYQSQSPDLVEIPT